MERPGWYLHLREGGMGLYFLYRVEFELSPARPPYGATYSYGPGLYM
jgi:hypothetical protein